MKKAKDVKEFVERVDQAKKVNPKDLSSDQDLTIAIMNLISIEEHLINCCSSISFKLIAWFSSVLFWSMSQTKRDLYFCPFSLWPCFFSFCSSMCGNPFLKVHFQIV